MMTDDEIRGSEEYRLIQEFWYKANPGKTFPSLDEPMQSIEVVQIRASLERRLRLAPDSLLLELRAGTVRGVVTQLQGYRRINS